MHPTFLFIADQHQLLGLETIHYSPNLSKVFYRTSYNTPVLTFYHSGCNSASHQTNNSCIYISILHTSYLRTTVTSLYKCQLAVRRFEIISTYPNRSKNCNQDIHVRFTQFLNQNFLLASCWKNTQTDRRKDYGQRNGGVNRQSFWDLLF
jgi:hypothetical protein